MSPLHYARFIDSTMTLMDELAVERTLLANERTLLAYLRSGVALFISGVTMIYLSEQRWFLTFGSLCLPSGITCAIIGVIRYRRVNRWMLFLRKMQNELELDSTLSSGASPSQQPAAEEDEEER